MMVHSEEENKGRWLFGVILTVGGTLVSALGNHLIVKSHSKKMDLTLAQLYFWMGNVCVVVLGTSLGIAALAYAPQSLISPLGGLTIVWNLVLATLPWFGNVRPKSVEIAATALTLIGTSAIVLLGPANSGTQNSFSVLVKPSFLWLAAGYVSLGAVLETIRPKNKLYGQIASGAMGGLIGGLSNVFAKSAIDFVSGNQVASESRDFVSFTLIVVTALVLAGAQLLLLNAALATFSAVQIVPIYQTSLVVAATISGGIAFDEFTDFNLAQFLGFGCGVLLSVSGVALLASVQSRTSGSTDELKD